MPWLERLMVGWVCVICLTTCLPTRSECGGAYPQKKVMCRKKKDYCARSLTVGNSLCWRMYTGVLLVLTGSTCQNPRKGITYINCQYFLYFLSCIVLNNSRLYISSPGTSLFVCLFLFHCFNPLSWKILCCEEGRNDCYWCGPCVWTICSNFHPDLIFTPKRSRGLAYSVQRIFCGPIFKPNSSPPTFPSHPRAF